MSRLAKLVARYRLPSGKLADGLTQRQMVVLSLRSIGASNEEIAKATFQTTQSVHNTVNRAIRRLRKVAKERGAWFPEHMTPAMLQRYVIRLDWDKELEKAGQQEMAPTVAEKRIEASRERWRNPA